MSSRHVRNDAQRLAKLIQKEDGKEIKVNRGVDSDTTAQKTTTKTNKEKISKSPQRRPALHTKYNRESLAHQSAQEFKNVSSPDTNNEEWHESSFVSTKTMDIMENSFRNSSTDHKRYFWLRRLSQFWIKNKGVYMALFPGIIVLIIIGWGMAAAPVLRLYSPFISAIGILVYALMALGPFWPFQSGILGSTNAVSSASKWSGAASLSLTAALLAVTVAVPLFVINIMTGTKISATDDGTKASEIMGSTAMAYNPAAAFMSLVISFVLFVVPVVCVMALVVWDVYTGVPTFFPINPTNERMGEMVQVNKVADAVATAASTGTPEGARMKNFFRRRGGIYYLTV